MIVILIGIEFVLGRVNKFCGCVLVMVFNNKNVVCANELYI